MPSTAKMLFDVSASAAILAGGAWLAATLSTPAEAVDNTRDAKPAGLTLQIDGVRNDTGKVIVLVFDSEDTSTADDHNKAVGFRELDARPGALAVEFPNLTTGPYAVSLFHDENTDYEFNMTDGIPLEGYGVSGAKGPYDDPGFAQASVQAGVVTIKMHYLDLR